MKFKTDTMQDKKIKGLNEMYLLLFIRTFFGVLQMSVGALQFDNWRYS